LIQLIISLIGLGIFLVVRNKESFKRISFFNDMRIIAMHQKKELCIINSFLEASLAIVIMLRLYTGTPICAAFGAILVMISFLTCYIRSLIVDKCNPPTGAHGKLAAYFPLGAVSLVGGGF